MITLTAKINFTDEEVDLKVLETTIGGNNISSGIKSVINKQRTVIGNPFLFGVSKLGYAKNFSDKVLYFLPSVSNEIFGMTVSGNGIKKLVIIFDTTNNVFPQKIYITNAQDYSAKLYENDSAIFSVELDAVDEIILTFYNLNKPNEQLKISGIKTDIDISLTKSNLINLSSQIISRSDLNLPSWGLKSNSSNLQFNDNFGEIEEYIERGWLENGVTLEIFLNDTISKTQELVGTFKTSDWDYDNDNKSISLTYKDELEEWQDINFDASYYTPTISDTYVSAQIFYDNIYQKATELGYKMKKLLELEEKTRKKIKETFIQFPMNKEKSLWNIMSDLCTVCQLYVYTEKDGTINCVYGAD